MKKIVKKNPAHTTELPKLNRIAGQIEGIKKMIDDNRYCVDILTQIKAVKAAISGVEKSIFGKHLDMCIKDAIEGSRGAQKKIDEIKKLMK